MLARRMSTRAMPRCQAAMPKEVVRKVMPVDSRAIFARKGEGD
jgi:hypothetical protein